MTVLTPGPRRSGRTGSQIVAHGKPDIGVAEVEADRDALPRRVLGGVDQGLLRDAQQRDGGVRGQRRRDAAVSKLAATR